MAEASGETWARRHAPELALAALAVVVFLGRLGAMDLWGKREQRAVAEAIDTVDHGRWLVATIQGRPRLEKPPLPRWTIATLITLTGVRDEWLVRLPSALSAVWMVGLVYGLGRRMAGRSAGLASGLALCSTFFFVVESRQAGNDGPLALFTTLALYAMFRRLHGGPADDPPGLPGDRLGARGWASLAWASMGLGFLSKGPIALLLPALAVVPYLALAGRLRVGLRALASAWGVLAFLALAMSWPLPVYLDRPKAVEIWMLEMGQKAGTAGITHHKQRYFYEEWPGMTAPWTLVAAWGVAMPFLGRGRALRPTVWLPWSWAMGNFAMFCLWSVAKPNYYVPCMPGVALLVGLGWVRLLEIARDPSRPGSSRAGRFVRAHAVVLGLAALAAPFYVARTMPEAARSILPALLAASACVLAGAVASLWCWRRRLDGGVMAGLVGGLAAATTIGYAAIIPRFNEARSHRDLAARLDRALPPGASTVMFYHELDEGLWYYLKGRALEPVPGTAPAYNTSIDFLDAARDKTLIRNRRKRLLSERQVLVDWLAEKGRATPYVLIRAKVFDLFNDLARPGLDAWADPVFREADLDRNELILLKVRDRPSVASGTAEERR